MKVWLDPQKLAAYNLTVLDIEKKIIEENNEFPAGRLESDTRDFSVRLYSGLNNVSQFEDLVVKKGTNFSYVKLKDVANIEIAPEEPRELFRGNGEEMISFGIVKQTSANLISVSKGVLQEWVQENLKDAKLRYFINNENGPPHDKRYRASVKINGEVFGEGEGKSKKSAEFKAAEDALSKLFDANMIEMKTGS